MIWLILTCIATVLSAFYGFIDNFITDTIFKGRHAQAQKVFFGGAYLLTALLIFLLFEVQATPVLVAVLLVVSGLIASLATIPYYLALSKDDTTNVTLLEQFSPLFYLIFGRFILGEHIGGAQLAAFLVVLSAPLLIILSSKRRSKGNLIKTAGFVLVQVTVGAFAHTLSTKFGAGVSPETMLFYLFIGKGIGDIVAVVAVKKWRQRWLHVWRKNHTSPKFWLTMVIDHLLYVGHDACYFTALILAPSIALAPAIIKTAKPIIVFIFGVIFSILWPNFGREKINRRAVSIRLIATTLAAVGVVLMQVLK
ncbi:hypothetical protein IKX64_02025 [Candidatus Saccharibacteria bacterium]|nr:hypothetical protein [Candidatus Saccharibacteria bacterium]